MRTVADRWIRWVTIVAVVTVSSIAAVVSYTHIQHVSLDNGQPRLDAALLPVSVDGLILAASMTAFYASRNRITVPFLARFALALGIGATIAANCLFGISHGWLGALLSAWPAIAFIFAMELVIWTVRIAAGGKVRRTSARGVTDASAVRSWARTQGLDVGARGRIAADVAEQYAGTVPAGDTTPDADATASTVTAPDADFSLAPEDVPDAALNTVADLMPDETAEYEPATVNSVNGAGDLKTSNDWPL